MIEKDYISFLCFTETKVDCINFIPKGIKLYNKHRIAGDRQGGGLTIGHIEDSNINLEEVETKIRYINSRRYSV